MTRFIPDGYNNLLTSQDLATARLPVDVAQTGFFEGREFRMSFEFDIASGQQQTVGDAVSSERGLPAGDYYLMLHAEGSRTRGVINLTYEIRP